VNKTTKIAFILFFLLIIGAIPLYIYSHPDLAQPDVFLQIKGKVSTPMNLTLVHLQTYAPATLQVTLSSSSHSEENGDFSYTGVLLEDLLNQSQPNSDASYVFIQASDGYGLTLTIQEAQNQNAIISYQKDGKPLSLLKDGGEGPLRLIIGGDEFAQRWIRGVVSIEIS
jgi:DMSO/TMAO reductase YedYZ molybdopterin-dependent catalytic subunit